MNSQLEYINFINLNSLSHFASNITKLDLSFSSISIINDKLFELFDNLNHLYLENNSICRINKNSFENLINLQFLNLRNNNIAFLSDETLFNLINLTAINISNNFLEYINEYLFCKNINLTHLLINNNKIIEINKKAFANNKKLKIVQLSNNLLESIYDETFESIDKPVEVNLLHNPLIYLNHEHIDGYFKYELIVNKNNSIYDDLIKNYNRLHDFKIYCSTYEISAYFNTFINRIHVLKAILPYINQDILTKIWYYPIHRLKNNHKKILLHYIVISYRLPQEVHHKILSYF